MGEGRTPLCSGCHHGLLPNGDGTFFCFNRDCRLVCLSQTPTRPPHQQARIDSFMEAVTNTAIGFVISMVTWIVVAWAFRIPMSWSTNLEITGIFTVVSIARQYVLRRCFDGRTPWAALKGRFARV